MTEKSKKLKLYSLIVGAAFAALTLSACAIETGLPQNGGESQNTAPKPDNAGEPGDADETGETETPETESDVAWIKFSDPRIDFSFQIPETWRVEDNGGDPAQGIFEFEVYDDEDERQLDYLSALYSSWAGEVCPADAPQMEITEYDVTPLALYDGAEAENLRFAYRIASDGQELYIGSVALLSGAAETGGSCVVSNVQEAYGPVIFSDMRRINFINPERYDREFETHEQATEFMQSDLYKNLKKIILSLETN